MYTINWSKEYHEDIGEEDENGLFDYVYQYVSYCFHLPDKTTIRARVYTDASDKCTFYFFDVHKKRQWRISEELWNCLPHVVDFMTVSQGVRQFSYFNGDYVPLLLKDDGRNQVDYSFAELTAEP